MKYIIPTILIIAFVGFVAYATVNTLPTNNQVASDKETSTPTDANINSDISASSVLPIESKKPEVTPTVTPDPLPVDNIVIEKPAPAPAKTPVKKIRYRETEEDD